MPYQFRYHITAPIWIKGCFSTSSMLWSYNSVQFIESIIALGGLYHSTLSNYYLIFYIFRCYKRPIITLLKRSRYLIYNNIYLNASLLCSFKQWFHATQGITGFMNSRYATTCFSITVLGQQDPLKLSR